MEINYTEIREWYGDLDKKEQVYLWQRFSTFLGDLEIRRTMEELQGGKDDLFEIHKRLGLIEKYQIYFFQIIRNFT